jgi:small-conductance mechanosensitive channel
MITADDTCNANAVNARRRRHRNANMTGLLSSTLQKRIGVFVMFSILAFTSWAVNVYYKDVDLTKLFSSALAVALAYLFFRIILEQIIAKRIREPKTRYSFRKTTQILFLVTSFVLVLRIWIINPQALVVAYGLVAAGVAIALQDLFKNFAGGIVIFTTGIYEIGNRIEIDGNCGDIIDVSILYTTILEIRGWVSGDQATGRITSVPNGLVLSSVINNYTKDHHFLWDEISIPVTYESDWKSAVRIMTEIATRETLESASEAKKSLVGLEEKYYLPERPTDPNVFITLTDNWIMLRLRYVIEVRERRAVHSRLSDLILREIERTPSITIASSTVSLVHVPEITLAGNSPEQTDK